MPVHEVMGEGKGSIAEGRDACTGVWGAVASAFTAEQYGYEVTGARGSRG